MTQRLLFAILALGLLVLAACNKQTTASGDAAVGAAGAGASQEPAAAAHDEHGAAETHAAEAAIPASITLADGKTLNVVAASAIDGDPKAHAGLVAIAGEVTKVYADKGAFMLKDNPKDEDCKTEDSCSCCSTAEVPVRLTMADYDGALPAAQDAVIVIAEVSPTAAGYTLAVREVRSGDKKILTRKA